MQVSNEIIEVLDYLCDKIGVAIDWTSDNAFPYLEQICGKFIKWEISTSIAWIALGIIFIIVGCMFIKPAKERWRRCTENYNEDDEALSIIYLVITVFLIVSAVIVISVQVFDIIECCTFPEKTIYDYIYTTTTEHL